jgi:hypothetical protein
MPLPFYNYFIVISLVASLIAYFKWKEELYLKVFPLFLLISMIAEIVAYQLAEKNGNNTVVSNCFSTFEFVFYFYVLHDVIHNRKAKKIIFHIGWVYVALVVVNFIFIQKITEFATTTYAVGCLMIVAICIYYFLELFQLSRSVDLLRQPAFWICSGLLFFYACSFPIFGFAKYINSLPSILVGHLNGILNLLNVFLYSSFTIAFLCRVRMKKSMS